MSDANIPVLVRKHKLPEWHSDDKGRPRGLKNGRWNMQRVAEYIIANPAWQTLDDLARIVYGANTKFNRKNVAKHIPPQRRFMLHSLQRPIVTQYGEHGRIIRIKLFNLTDENDKMLLRIDLDRAKDRKEMSENAYEYLLNIFLLEDHSESAQKTG